MNIQRLYPFIFLLASPVIAADTDPGPYLQTAASYRIYGGELGDPTASRPNDKKWHFPSKAMRPGRSSMPSARTSETRAQKAAACASATRITNI
jgi:hypothetical protein